jgi:hypothetical protein
MKNLRTLLWIYLWFLFLEGALRKWIVPALDAPLLVIRDPLVLLIYLQAYQNRLSFNNAFFTPNLVLCVLTAVLSLLAGSGNPFITAYGIHADFLQIPLIFLIPQILNRDDVIAMGRAFLYASIPMAGLVILQFLAAPDSILNKGALLTWYGTVRPSGTFSFIAGLVSYFALTATFLFYGYLQPRIYQIWLVAAVTFSVLLASACSGSRSCLVSVGIVAVVAVLCVIVRGKGGRGIVIAAIVIALLVPILSALPVFQKGFGELTQRFADASATEDGTQGFILRFAGTLVGPIVLMGNAPILGAGLGMGTNVAAGLLTGQRGFLGAEDEWGRLIFESGPIFCLLLIVFRVALTFTIAVQAYQALRRDNILPILIFAGCGLLILNGQWGVPTTLGFAVFGAGITLAACVEPEEDEYDHDHEDEHLDDNENPRAHDESDPSRETDAVT